MLYHEYTLDLHNEKRNGVLITVCIQDLYRRSQQEAGSAHVLH